MAQKIYSDPVITPLARIAFCNLFEPERVKRDDGTESDEFNATLLIPKTDPAIARMVAAHDQVMEKLYGPKQDQNGNYLWPQFRNQAFRDGDADPTYRNREKYPGFEGMWVVKATSNQQPGLLDGSRGSKQPVIAKGVLYSGMWGFAELVASNYESKGNQGIKFYINNFMKYKDDARMGGGGRTAEEAFSGIAAAPGQAAPGGMPGAPMGMPGMMPGQPPISGMTGPFAGSPTPTGAYPSNPAPMGGPAAPAMPMAPASAAPAAPAFPGYAAPLG